MASYNGNIDLLSLNGAQVFKGIDTKNPERVYVCIPADVNEIKVEQAPQDPTRTLAKMRMNKRLAMLYQPQSTQQPSPYATPNVGVAGAVTGYVAPAEANNDPFAGNTYNEEDDLPF